MRPLVTIFTVAYNAEGYIRETIESVLNQDEPNIEYFIRDNGSTDGTYAIMKEYAEKDSRVRIVRNEVNYRKEDGTLLNLEDYCPDPKGEYITLLDSDDLLKPNYVSRLYQAAKQCNADIAIAGTEMFADKSGEILLERFPSEFVFHAGEKMKADDFMETYGMLRTLWGKLFRTEFFLSKVGRAEKAWETFYVVNGGDTVWSLSFLGDAKCVVSIHEMLHCYRIKQQGNYQVGKPDVDRIREGVGLFYAAVELLPKLKLSFEEVGGFLYVVLFSHIKDLLDMVRKSVSMSEEERFVFCEAVLTCDLLMSFPGQEHMIRNWENTVEKPILQIVLKKEFEYNRNIISFLQDIAVFFTQPGVLPQSIKDLYLIQGVFHKNNTYYYGFTFLEHLKKRKESWYTIFLNTPLVKQKSMAVSGPILRELILKSSVEECSELKATMLDLYDAGVLETALQMALRILETNPVDPEGIYFGMALAYELKQDALLSILLDMQRKFWPYHEELKQLAGQIMEKKDSVGM
ncbi:MAG: glycosyltransferase family 2 protein [Lachnospiraceae bacterium]